MPWNTDSRWIRERRLLGGTRQILTAMSCVGGFWSQAKVAKRIPNPQGVVRFHGDQLQPFCQDFRMEDEESKRARAKETLAVQQLLEDTLGAEALSPSGMRHDTGLFDRLVLLERLEELAKVVLDGHVCGEGESERIRRQSQELGDLLLWAADKVRVQRGLAAVPAPIEVRAHFYPDSCHVVVCAKCSSRMKDGRPGIPVEYVVRRLQDSAGWGPLKTGHTTELVCRRCLEAANTSGEPNHAPYLQQA